MSQPGSSGGRASFAGAPRAPGPAAPVRVVSERLTAEEAMTVADVAVPLARPAPPPVVTPVMPATPTPSALPVLRPDGLPVLAPRPPRRLRELVALVFSRRAGRHRPETTTTQSWSMVSPQRRRRSRRWGRR